MVRAVAPPHKLTFQSLFKRAGERERELVLLFLNEKTTYLLSSLKHWLFACVLLRGSRVRTPVGVRGHGLVSSSLPRAPLERCDAERRRSAFLAAPWWPAPLPFLHPAWAAAVLAPGVAAFAFGSAPAKGAAMAAAVARGCYLSLCVCYY